MSATPVLKEGAEDLSLIEALALLQSGMQNVAFDIVKFQAMVGDLVRAAGSSGDEAVIERAQAIDAMAQALFRLTRSAEAIGEACIACGAGETPLGLDRTAKADLRQSAKGQAASDGGMELF